MNMGENDTSRNVAAQDHGPKLHEKSHKTMF